MGSPGSDTGGRVAQGQYPAARMASAQGPALWLLAEPPRLLPTLWACFLCL